MSTEELSHDWAAQRIKNLSLGKAIANALGWRASVTSLIEEFHYPRFGPGMMWTAAADRLRSNGGRLLLNTELRRLHHEDGAVRAVSLQSPGGTTRESVDYVVSSAPLPDLVASLDPSPPETVRRAASLLRYRDMVVVGLIVDHPGSVCRQLDLCARPQREGGANSEFQELEPRHGSGTNEDFARMRVLLHGWRRSVDKERRRPHRAGEIGDRRNGVLQRKPDHRWLRLQGARARTRSTMRTIASTWM